ncbi:MAG: ankyrin repeat domain-containing protein, partial [Betaproteobacteria bacterium]|nr:ankyrin repeat domain-containing protein [Betaproteobacteria bacterium]
MYKKNLFIFLLIGSFFASIAYAEESVNYLLTAASKGDVETVSAILESGGNPNTKDEDGVTALMYAARKDMDKIIALLIKKGAAVNATENNGWTALMFAAKKNYVRSVQLL